MLCFVISFSPCWPFSCSTIEWAAFKLQKLVPHTYDDKVVFPVPGRTHSLPQWQLSWRLRQWKSWGSPLGLVNDWKALMTYQRCQLQITSHRGQLICDVWGEKETVNIRDGKHSILFRGDGSSSGWQLILSRFRTRGSNMVLTTLDWL